VNITLYDLAQRFVGMKEIPGQKDSPLILAMLRLDGEWPQNDEVAWCSAFVNFCAWLLRLPRSKSLGARSWLRVGTPVLDHLAKVGWDVVVLARGDGKQPGPEVISAPGHVGLFAGWETSDRVLMLGGNQGDTVCVASFPRTRILGIRRLYDGLAT
jgi:uncharacterized protein (TIGR02594 family)